MRSDKSAKTSIFLALCLLLLQALSHISGQVSDSSSQISGEPKPYIEQPSVARPSVTKSQENAAEPDTNFTFEKYGEFLNKISDPQKFIVLPLNEFRTTFDNSKIVVGLRHDVDIDLSHALSFSATEYNLGFRSTYYILHTAPYYLQTPGNMAVHTENIIPILKKMQDERHFEIGWHNDLVTLQIIYKLNSIDFLKNEMAWLRSKGIRVTGTASHGSPYCHTYGYLNYYFFEECSSTPVLPYVNNVTIPIESQQVDIMKGKLRDFGLDYEAYFLNNNKAYSDATVTNGIRWNTSMLDISRLVPGDRVIVLVHPIHWHKASVKANIDMFSIPGQKASYIDSLNSSVTIIVPHDTDLGNLIPFFKLSPGAYAKVSGAKQSSGVSAQNFNSPALYTVYAENRSVTKEWKVDVKNELILEVPGEGESADSMEIYPNPADALVNIRFTGSTAPQRIEIYSFEGRRVYEETLDQTGDFVKQTDLSFLTPGIYVVRNATTGKKVFLIIR